MSGTPEADIAIDVDLRNPGQFFACCGLLELASRLWPASAENGWSEPEGWFERSPGGVSFKITGAPGGTARLVDILLASGPLAELADDHEPHAKDRKPLLLRKPFFLRLDWWLDSYRGADKSELKVWAGQMTPIGNLSMLQEKLRSLHVTQADPARLLSARIPASGLGIDPATSWTAINVGFSPDVQGVSVMTAPATEILAMIGLQRCRPVIDETERRRWFVYRSWSDPVPVTAAPVAIAGSGRNLGTFRFPVVMRNAQYGNFGWANPVKEER